MTTGSSGRRRLASEEFKALKFPLAPMAAQRELATDVARRRAEAKSLRDHAEIIWKTARKRFEERLLNEVGQ